MIKIAYFLWLIIKYHICKTVNGYTNRSACYTLNNNNDNIVGTTKKKRKAEREGQGE